jgi:hypothetical protein
MAKAMLKVRAVSLSEDFQPYWRLPVAREHGPLQAPGRRCIASRQSSYTPINSQGTPGHVSEYGDEL